MCFVPTFIHICQLHWRIRIRFHSLTVALMEIKSRILNIIRCAYLNASSGCYRYDEIKGELQAGFLAESRMAPTEGCESICKKVADFTV